MGLLPTGTLLLPPVVSPKRTEKNGATEFQTLPKMPQPNINIKPKFLGSGEPVNLVSYQYRSGRLTTQRKLEWDTYNWSSPCISALEFSFCPFLGGNWLS